MKKKAVNKSKMNSTGIWFEDSENGISHYFENGETHSICRRIYFNELLTQNHPKNLCPDCERRISSDV